MAATNRNAVVAVVQSMHAKADSKSSTTLVISPSNRPVLIGRRRLSHGELGRFTAIF